MDRFLAEYAAWGEQMKQVRIAREARWVERQDGHKQEDGGGGGGGGGGGDTRVGCRGATGESSPVGQLSRTSTLTNMPRGLQWLVSAASRISAGGKAGPRRVAGGRTACVSGGPREEGGEGASRHVAGSGHSLPQASHDGRVQWVHSLTPAPPTLLRRAPYALRAPVPGLDVTRHRPVAPSACPPARSRVQMKERGCGASNVISIELFHGSSPVQVSGGNMYCWQ